MSLSVKDRGEAVATFRYVHVASMETLAAWTPSTPEMEVKLMFGEHIWNLAQQADAFGKRTLELRLPLQHSIEPVDRYLRLLTDVRQETATAHRLAGFYDVVLPGLAVRFGRYLEQTDSLMDAPTVRIVEHCLDVQAKMIKDGLELREQFPVLNDVDKAWVESALSDEAQVQTLVRAA